MTNHQQQSRRAHEALARALAAAPDDFAHPDWDTLASLAAGTLPDADREAVTSHVDDCRVCAEDLADVTAVQAGIGRGATASHRGRRRVAVWWLGAAATVAIAGGLVGLQLLNSDLPPVAEPGVSGSAPPVASRTTSLVLRFEEQQVVAEDLIAGRIAVPAAVRALMGETGTLLGDTSRVMPFGPIAPMGTAIASSEPRLSWSAMPGALGYTAAVYDERFREVARSSRLTETSWQVPPLVRGESYAWQVTAYLNDGSVVLSPTPPRPEARFHVLDAGTAARVAEQQSRLAGEPLALGILMGRAGLMSEARDALGLALASARDGERARALLAQLPRQGAPTTTNPAQ